MEGLQHLHRRVAGIDVHRMLHVVTAVIEQLDGSIEQFSREFGGFKRDCRALAAWLTELGVELVVMESTGIYWKSVHAHLLTRWVLRQRVRRQRGARCGPLGRRRSACDRDGLRAVVDKWAGDK